MLKAFDVTREQTTVGTVEVVVFRVTGYLDAHTAPRFEDALHEALDEGRSCFVVDCVGLDYISSAGLGVLIDAYRTIRPLHGRLAVAAMSPAIADIFDILGFSKVIEAYPDLAEALASFGSPPAEGST